MKHCILEDASFVVAVIDINDKFHNDAVYIFKKILKDRKEIKIIIPSIVFFESIITLIKKGIDKNLVEDKLWKFLYILEILNFPIIETSAFKLCKTLSSGQLVNLKTSDYMIVNIGIEFDAQILTFDKKMRNRVRKIYPTIYYCSAIDTDEDDTERFLKDFDKALGQEGEIDLDDIPF
ncbi:hypothetical protein ES702_00905 [subsurface metagenome]